MHGTLVYLILSSTQDVDFIDRQMTMTAEQLRALYRQQLLIEALVEPSLDNEGWVVECRHAAGGLMALTNADGVEQCFLDIDQATLNALEIGFQQVRIVD
jgi:hypothetical protein